MAVLVNRTPELHQVLDRIRGWPDGPHRVMRTVEQAPGDRGYRHGIKRLDDPVVVVLTRVLGEERLPELTGLIETGARAGDKGVLEQAVVLAEADEDGGEDP